MQNKKIWLSSPHMGGGEQKYVQEAFDSNWVAPLGPNVKGFENDLQSYLGGDVHLTALSSGTAAIHLALKLLGVEQGDHVICQSMTFSASANPIIYANATPVFVDSERLTWNMCPDALEKAISASHRKGKLPKAIIPVHLYGMPAQMTVINEIADHWGIPILEDAAEALGSHIQHRNCGTFGKFACLSFNGNKIITTSGGGALVSSTREDANKALFLATQAREDQPHYEHREIGYNYRLSNVLAGIGRGQMEALDAHVAARRANWAFYKDALQDISEISMLEEPDGYFSNRWLSCILVRPSSGLNRETIRLALSEENIESRPLWKPMHLQPIFQQYPFYGENIAESLFQNGLCLPSGSNLTGEDLTRVVACIKKLYQSN
ncbi:pyridoxal phosphate-dependent aminotransferase [Pedobacter yulinensis]|uniref:Pyridoxal phosphate-dependent aminotransferase n=1 Tax=Pedobacter yulinensis TaxID=2126353 RepID=A0A2T3HNN5_9SPHI|nr:DegT/DnrJ/EryC1/StrS family aminotransferase [Pedobacter yulinensis]PST84062.1 pyridoxal phosphate-dependent aminotransferase [Pedobacter yulinensis]